MKKLNAKELEIINVLAAWLECNIEQETAIHFDNNELICSEQVLPVLQKLIKTL